MSESDSRVQAVAAALIDAHRLHRTIDLPAPIRSADEAYRVQDIVARSLWSSAGIAVTAWKTGAPDLQATPIAAPIARPKVFASGATLPGGDFHVIGIEAELAYTIAVDLPPRASAYVESDVRAAIASIHPAIEVCDTRLAGWKAADPLAKLADNQMNGALIVGPARRDWRSVDPHRQAAIVEVDGERRGESIGAHPCGDPIVLLAWLANHGAARCGGLRAGDVITTGAWTGMHMVAPRSGVMVRFPGIGEARVTFR